MDEKSILHEIDVQLRTALNYTLALKCTTDNEKQAIQKIREAQIMLQKGFRNGKENT